MADEKHLNAQLQSLNQNIDELNSYLSKQTSVKWRFMMGLVTGVSTAIGATIIAGLIIFMVTRFVESIYELPIIGEQLPQEQIDRLLEN